MQLKTKKDTVGCGIRNRRGFIFIEILLSMGIIGIIWIPIFYFIWSDNSFLEKKVVAFSDIRKRYISKQQIWMGQTHISNTLESQVCTVGTIDVHSDPGVEADGESTNHAQNIEYITQVEFPSGVTVTSTIYLNGRLIVGADSASTTMPDIFIVDYNTREVIDRYDIGPGIIGLSGDAHRVFGIQRSLVSPLQKIEFDENMSTKITQVSLPISYVYPKTIYATKSDIFIGLEKNLGPELLWLTESTPDISAPHASVNLISSQEIGASVNDISITAYDIDSSKIKQVFIANPTDHELFVYVYSHDQPNVAPVLLKLEKLDTYGQSGNGKSLSMYRDLILLGRTVGNDEIIMIKNSPEYMTTATSTTLLSTIGQHNPNASIVDIEFSIGGASFISLEKSSNSSLVLYGTRGEGGAPQEISRAELLFTPLHMYCRGRYVYVSGESNRLLIYKI